MPKKNTVEIKKNEKKALKLKIEKAKAGFDMKVGTVKMNADGVASVKGNKTNRTYYFKDKKHNTRAYVTINDEIKAKGSSLNLKKVMEAVERSTQKDMFQQFLNKIVASLSYQDFAPVAIIIYINISGFTVCVNGDFTYSRSQLFWTEKEKDNAIIGQIIRDADKNAPRAKSDTEEVLAEGYKESL